MASFTFADFLVFAGTGNINEDTYVTVAKGVINYIKAQYGIYPESESITFPIFLARGQRSVLPPGFPIQNINSITYDGVLLDQSTYSYYGEDILLDTAIEDTRKPLVLDLLMGYPINEVPDDLVLAVYRHILAVYYSIDKHTDNVDKAINTSGNTTYFSKEVVPLASKITYQFYAGNTLIKV